MVFFQLRKVSYLNMYRYMLHMLSQASQAHFTSVFPSDKTIGVALHWRSLRTNYLDFDFFQKINKGDLPFMYSCVFFGANSLI